MKTVNELWQQSQNDAEGMRLGYTTQQHYFAALVRADEREACAKVCETLWDTPNNGMATEEECYGNECAEVIRARGETAPPKEIDPNQWAFDNGLEST